MALAIDALLAMGHDDACRNISETWEEYLGIVNDRRDPAFDEAYPPHLMNQVVDLTLKAAEQMGGKMARIGASGAVRTILNSAWEDFWRDPAGYPNRENGIAARLDRVL